jgi:hypothetical protein
MGGPRAAPYDLSEDLDAESVVFDDDESVEVDVEPLDPLELLELLDPLEAVDSFEPVDSLAALPLLLPASDVDFLA